MTAKILSHDDDKDTPEARFITQQIAMLENECTFLHAPQTSGAHVNITRPHLLRNYQQPFEHVAKHVAFYRERVPASLLINYLQAIERLEAAIDLKARSSPLS